MKETTLRACLQCGLPFAPKQESSRFCCRQCSRAYYQQNYNAAKKGTSCEYNEAIICNCKNCSACGWNPSVATSRLLAFRRKQK